MSIQRIHHIQVTMPKGGEARARQFYRDLLGIAEVMKPAHLAARGGCWFESGEVRVHVGVEEPFSPAGKAHPALLVDDLAQLVATLAGQGFPARYDQPRDGFDRCYVSDPFGNRIELMQMI